MSRSTSFALVVLLVLSMALAACQPVQPVQAQPQTQSTLATARAVAQNSNMAGHVLISARGNHFLISSAPPLGHEALEITPVDAMLGALATCGIFIFEAVAIEQSFPLDGASAVVQADWDVRGLIGEEGVNPHMQALRVHLTVGGLDADQIEFTRQQYISRCPIYTTLERAAPIEITINDEAMSGPVAEGLAMTSITATLTNQPGRAIISVRNHYMVIDSVTPLGFPSEETNPMDIFLGAIISCATLLAENHTVANEIALTDAVVSVEADFDPRGLRGEEGVSPRIQAMRVHWTLAGVDDAQAEEIVGAWLARCPIYNTYVLATDLTVTHEVVDGVIARQ